MKFALTYSDTRIMREPAMVITAQRTVRMVTMMVHIVSSCASLKKKKKMNFMILKTCSELRTRLARAVLRLGLTVTVFVFSVKRFLAAVVSPSQPAL